MYAWRLAQLSAYLSPTRDHVSYDYAKYETYWDLTVVKGKN